MNLLIHQFCDITKNGPKTTIFGSAWVLNKHTQNSCSIKILICYGLYQQQYSNMDKRNLPEIEGNYNIVYNGYQHNYNADDGDYDDDNIDDDDDNNIDGDKVTDIMIKQPEIEDVKNGIANKLYL